MEGSELLHTEARHLDHLEIPVGEPCLEVRQQGEITVHDPGFQHRADGRPYPRDGCDVPVFDDITGRSAHLHDGTRRLLIGLCLEGILLEEIQRLSHREQGFRQGRVIH